nr:immunoglobulin light chain junction region [Macaca mulatta]MPO07952.1 immunoglobulin light chain junction region [Macaca mulatta]MPO09526.1 immunoglobulin light chain junction region [Macaca mulatta]
CSAWDSSLTSHLF